MPWCNATLAIEVRVADMVGRMTLAEKIPNLNTNAPKIDSLGLPAYNWWSESSSGVMAPVDTTKFAFPITTGMSFNRTLWQMTGRQIGHEARALMNVGKGLSTFWAPVVNLAREPRWGRNIEVPSEDPYQSGEYAEWFVKGMEQAPEDPYHIQASACCKHYAANSMEHSTECGVTHTRHDYDAKITEQDLVDSYLLPFQACVEKGKVSGLMCS
jgi:pre-mRNA-splicing factor SYF2/beta-D-xylosidase 4